MSTRIACIDSLPSPFSLFSRSDDDPCEQSPAPVIGHTVAENIKLDRGWMRVHQQDQAGTAGMDNVHMVLLCKAPYSYTLSWALESIG